MKNKLIFLDTETTGLDPIENGVVQISGIIETEGKEQERFNFRCRPFVDDTCEEDALKVIGFTEEELRSQVEPYEVYTELKDILNKYVNPFDTSATKFISVGYNFNFDLKFLNAYFNKCIDAEKPEVLETLFNAFDARFSTDTVNEQMEWMMNYWRKNGDVYFNSYMKNHLDVRQMYVLYCLKKDMPMPRYTKLSYICEQFDIYIQAHDAMSDINATRDLYYVLKKGIEYMTYNQAVSYLKKLGAISDVKSAGRNIVEYTYTQESDTASTPAGDYTDVCYKEDIIEMAILEVGHEKIREGEDLTPEERALLVKYQFIVE